MAEHSRPQQNPRRQLQGAVLLAAVAACLAALLLLAAPALLRQQEATGRSTTEQALGEDRPPSTGAQEGPDAWLYRGVVLLGVACVALMLGALIWVVRLAARITAPPESGGDLMQQPLHAGETPECALMGTETDERRSLAERALAVGRETAGILDPDVLARRAVDVIRQEFLPVCVGLFLVDDAEDRIALRVGMCENGEAIVPQGHGVRPGQGRLGRSVADAQSHVSVEPAEALLLCADPELRDSRAEAVIPLRSQGRAIGALVLQDRDPEAFDEASVSALQGMADQLGSAIEAAYAYVGAQAALHSAHEALGQIYQEVLPRAFPGEVLGYHRLSHGAVEPVQGEWDEDMAQAIADGHAMCQGRTLVVPIRIRDAVAGAVRLQKPDVGPGWSDREIDLARAIVEHLGPALESARLHTELRAAHARTRLAHAAQNWDTLMQTAVREIGAAVQASRVFVQWMPSTSDASGPAPEAESGDGAQDR